MSGVVGTEKVAKREYFIYITFSSLTTDKGGTEKYFYIHPDHPLHPQRSALHRRLRQAQGLQDQEGDQQLRAAGMAHDLRIKSIKGLFSSLCVQIFEMCEAHNFKLQSKKIHP